MSSRTSTAGQTRLHRNSRTVLAFMLAILLLALMAWLAGGAALRESVAFDELAHIGAGLSYLQKLDMRLNEEHPPLAKMLAVLPLVLRGTRADYSSVSWTASKKFLPAYLGQWAFGEWVLKHWNDPVATLAWARFPMLLCTLALGWVVFVFARRLGGDWGGLLCLAIYVSTPVFIAFGPLVLTDVTITLFSLLALWAFADLWQEPSKRNVALFALALAAALLSKFTAGLLFFAFAGFALSTRWRPVPGQPLTKTDVRAWRRLRWRSMWKGVLDAAVLVYVFYLFISWNQPTDAFYRLGNGVAAMLLRRLLMPPLLYFRGVFLVVGSALRPTFLLGHKYPHGVWYYFPVLFALKSTLGFLALLVLALLATILAKRSRPTPAESGQPVAIPAELGVHWRVLWVSLVVFTVACMASHFDISIRHFMIPTVLLILLLAPLPRLLARIGTPSARAANMLTAALAACSLFAAVHAYPFYIPFVNSLSLRHPAYELFSDSNLDWNQALPEVKRFAEQHGLQKIPVDEYGFTSLTGTVPQAEFWNCQTPAAEDAGQWVAVSAGMILDVHNCGWLLRYPHESLGGGSMYALHLADSIPPAGEPGGPPLPADSREFFGAPVDIRLVFMNVINDPEKLREAMAQFEASQQKPKK
jgi:hypothetical protein